jgi:hypothetical protein
MSEKEHNTRRNGLYCLPVACFIKLSTRTAGGLSVPAEVEAKSGSLASAEKRPKPGARPGQEGPGERRRARLCSLQFVEMARTDSGFQIIVSVGDERRSFVIPTASAKQILNELEIASQIIRSQM